MKINANEKVLLMNKKIGTMGAEPAPVPETTVSNPENSMKALETIGKQNIAFRGGLTSVAEKGVQELAEKNSGVVKKGVRKIGKKAAMLATAAMLAIPALNSCTEDTFIDINIPTTIDMSEFTTALNAANAQLSTLTGIVANMQAQQAVQTELYRQQLALIDDQYELMLKIYQEVLNQGKTQDEMKDNLEEFCNKALAQFENIIEMLGTDSPIYQKMTEFMQEYKDGKITLFEYFENLRDLVKSIDNKMDTLIGQNDDIKDRMDKIINNQVEQQNLTKEQQEAFMKAYNKILAEIQDGNITNENFYQNAYQQWAVEDEQRDVIIELLEQLGYTQDEALKYLESLDARAEKGEESAKAAFEELMEKLNSIDNKLATLIKQNDAIKEQMSEVINLLVENNSITAAQKEEFMNAYNEILAEIKAGNINDENFYQNVYQQWAVENDQRDVIIEVLVQQGYTQEEAVEYLKSLDVRAEKSESSAKAAFEELMNKLSSIEAKIEKLVEYAETFMDNFDAYAKQVKSMKNLLKQINNGVSSINTAVVNINSGLNESLANLEQELKNIKEAINNASVENVAAITDGKDEIIAVMEKLGYEEQEVIKMSKDEIIAAIDKNTERVKDNGAVLSQILSYVAVLPEMRDAQLITNSELQTISKKLDNLDIDVEISPETLAELEVLFDKYFDELKEILNEINDNITTQGEGAIAELKKTNVSISGMKDDVKELKDNSAILVTYDQYILDAIKNVGSGVTNIEEIAAQIGVDVSWIREHGGGSGQTVDLSKIEKYLEQEVANTQATNYVVNLMYAEWSGDLDTIKKYLEDIKNLQQEGNDGSEAILEVLNSIDYKNDLIIAAINAFADQEKISDQTRDEWLEKIYNKKCDCAKDVTIVVEKIYKYLVDGNEGIVDYDKLFDDLFGDDTSTKAMASATKTFTYKISPKQVNNLYTTSQFYETAANLYAQTPKAQKGFRAFQRAADQQHARTFNA